MRIGISTSVIQRGRTGIAQHVFGLLNSFHDVTSTHRFILFVLEQDLPLFDPVRSEMEIVPVPEKYRPPTANIAWHQFKLPEFVRRLQIDVLHVPSYRRLLWPKPCPLVATIHDLAPFRVPGKYDPLRMIYGRVIARQLARRQDEIIAVSQQTARDICQFFGIPMQRLTVIRNGIDHERFHPGECDRARSTVQARFGIHAPFFLYVARLEHPGKNHLRLIDAFAAFKAATQSDWHLALAGSDWHGAEAIRDAIRRSPAARHIHCLGFVPDELLPDLYRAAGAFVYPSLYEGFGLPPVEAMACGSPVVASARGALAEVIGTAGLSVDPKNTNDLRRQLERVATDTQLRRQLRRAGLEHAKQFAWKTAAMETVRVYERAAARNGCSPRQNTTGSRSE